MRFYIRKSRRLAGLLLYLGSVMLLFATALLLKMLFIKPSPLLLPLSPEITVINKLQEKEQIELERFLLGVLAAEMPASFETEALKAQAIAARTYIVNNMAGSGVHKHEDAVVCCDFAHCQAYCDEEEMHAKWDDAFAGNYAKLKNAVSETAGLIMLWHGEPIDALYSSTCGGSTVDAKSYWGAEIPYLQSRECGYCLHSPRYVNTQSFTAESAAKLLNCQPQDIEKKLRTLSARAVREKLALYSAKFTFIRQDGEIVFTTRGSGHGVGLCQYGADGMARAGRSAEEILHHYYTDIDIVNVYAAEGYLPK